MHNLPLPRSNALVIRKCSRRRSWTRECHAATVPDFLKSSAKWNAIVNEKIFGKTFSLSAKPWKSTSRSIRPSFLLFSPITSTKRLTLSLHRVRQAIAISLVQLAQTTRNIARNANVNLLTVFYRTLTARLLRRRLILKSVASVPTVSARVK